MYNNWNQQEVPEKNFDICISQTLSKNTKVTTDDYLPEYDDECKYPIPNTKDTSWEDVYAENKHFTPAQLLALFARYLDEEINHNGIIPRTPSYLRHLKDECSNWIIDETEITD